MKSISRSKNSKLTLIGLIILFAVSMVLAEGKKQPEISPGTDLKTLPHEEEWNLQQLYLNVVAETVFKTIKPEEKAKGYYDEWYSLYNKSPIGWVGLEKPPILKNLFPKVKFYLISGEYSYPRVYSEHPERYIKAFFSNKFYSMPSDFNRLLNDNGFKVSDKNIIRLAQAFILISLCEENVKWVPPVRRLPGTYDSTPKPSGGFPKVTFLVGKRIKEERMIGKKKNITYSAQLKVKVGDEIRNWYLPQDIYKKGQFGGATVNDKNN
jgi:hypothetical protein